LEAEKKNLQIQKWVTLVSVILFIVKIIAFVLTNSLTILSDALESIVNVMAGFIGLYSLYVASKPRDLEHPYGHGKAEFISAAAEGGLVVTAGILIIYEAIKNAIEHNPIVELDKGIILIAFTAVVNFIMGSICLRQGRKNNSLALQASGKHLQTDTLSTLGVIAGVGLIILTKKLWIDTAVALLMSGIIIYNGYKILRQSLAGIMDEADMEILTKMLKTLNENRRENWIDLHNLRVIKYGSRLHIDCHLTVPWYLNVNEAHEEVDALSKVITDEFGSTIEMFVHTDGCLPISCPICVKHDCAVRQHEFVQRIPFTLENILSNKKHSLQDVSASI
jgi:cation diffusion facilitator family transporter